MSFRTGRRVAQGTSLLLCGILFWQDTACSRGQRLELVADGNRVVWKPNGKAAAQQVGHIDFDSSGDGAVKADLRTVGVPGLLAGTFAGGKAAGEWTLRGPEGAVLVSQTYRDGRLDGRSIASDAHGIKVSEALFAGGKLDGEAVFYGPQGAQRRYTYSKGALVNASFPLRSGVNVRFESGRYVLEHDGASLWRFPSKLCRVADTGELFCKTPRQIEHDLSSFLPPEVVAQWLEMVNSIYEELDLERSHGILAQCAGTFVSTALDPGSPVVQQNSEHRAVVTRGEVDGVLAACRTAAQAAIEAHYPPNQRNPYGDAVGDAKERGDAAVAACSPSSAERFVGVVPLVAFLAATFGLTTASAEAAAVGVIVTAFGSAVAGAGFLIERWMDDGYTPWTDVGDGRRRRESAADPNGIKQWEDTRTGTTTTVIVDGTGETHVTTLGEYVETVRYDKNGNVVQRTLTDKDGNPVTDQDGNVPTGETIPPAAPKPTLAPSDAPPNPTPAPSDAPPKKGKAAPSIPSEDAVSCESIAQRWALRKERCDAVDWKTYDCQQLVRVLTGCGTDQTRIKPNPEGELSCSPEPPKSGKEALCEARRMFAIVDPSYDCAVVLGEDIKSRLERDICRDPRAECILADILPNPRDVFQGAGLPGRTVPQERLGGG